MKTTDKTPLTISKIDRVRIAMQYVGHMVASNVTDWKGRLITVDESHLNYILMATHGKNCPAGTIHISFDKGSIEVKPLGRISDEDKSSLKNMCGPYDMSIHTDNGETVVSEILKDFTEAKCYRFTISLRDILRVTDFLRSRGYALPWGGYSVEQLVEAGIYKLTD